MASADLRSFVEEAGKSLGAAQHALVGDISDVPTQLAISTADLEVKAGFARATDGTLLVETVSVADIVARDIEVGALSTVKLQYVAVGEEGAAPGPPPTKQPEEVIEDVRVRPDVKALDRILDGLTFDTLYVPPIGSWLVRATDARGRVVREIIVADA